LTIGETRAGIATQHGPHEPPGHALAVDGDGSVAVEILLQHDRIRRGHGDRVERANATAGQSNLRRQTSERHARALLRLRTRDAECPGALALVQQCEGGGRDEGEDRDGDEKIGEAHAGSVGGDAARVNVQ
jgi:hypothetical protein